VLTGVAGAARALSPAWRSSSRATFAMGVGISIMQPAFPAVVRDWVPQRIALGTATYSNGLLVGEALIGVAHDSLRAARGRRKLALGARGVVGPVMLIAAVRMGAAPAPRMPPPPRRRRAAGGPTGAIRSRGSWACSRATPRRCTSATNAFLPDYLAVWRGRPDLVNATLSALNWVQMPASVLMLLYARHLSLKRWPFLALQAVSIVSIAGLLAMDDYWIVVWAGAIGFCNAFLLILTLALPPLIASSDDVHRLAAGMIAIGYLCAFVIPILGGAIWDATGSAPAAFLPLGVFALVAIGLAATLHFHERTILRP
jgi:CP family cyanate transporter-like MFS transporter